MSAELRVLIAGAGRHHGLYPQAFAAQPGVRVVGVWVSDSSRADVLANATALAAEFLVDLGHDLATMVGAADIVVCCTGPAEQPKVAGTAIDAGLSVWLDQPLASHRAALDELTTRVVTASGTVGVGSRVFSRPVAAARRAIDVGDVGIPFAVHLDLIAATPAGAPLEGALDPTFLGGQLTRLGPLACGIVLHLLRGEARDIHASTTQGFYADHRAAGVEDGAVLSIGIGDDASATVLVGRAPIAAAGATVYEAVRLRGTRGSITADSSHRLVTPVADQAEPELVGAAVADFLRVVRGESSRLVHDFAAARAAWILSAAAHKSHTDHALIHLDDLDTE